MSKPNEIRAINLPAGKTPLGLIARLRNLMAHLPTSGSSGNYFAKLKQAHQAGNLTLVLGAGASAERGVLTWNTLLQELLLETIEDGSNENSAQSRVLAWAFQSIFDPNPLIAARYLTQYHKQKHANNPLAFLEQVRTNLYRGLKPSKADGLLAEIRQLCMAVGKSPNLKSVITYNFDDLLEEELLKNGQGVKFRPIYTPGTHATAEELAVYHVHGYLPQMGSLTEANQVIFSEDYYHRQYGEVYHWSNLVQINAFAESNCLLTGVSLTDPNQRRLLDIAMKLRGDSDIHHYCIKRRYHPKFVEESLTWELKKQPELMKAKINAQLQEGDAIKHLIRITQNFEEKDAASLGVGIIWVNEFDEYAEVLKRIRTGNTAPMPGAVPSSTSPITISHQPPPKKKTSTNGGGRNSKQNVFRKRAST